MTPLILSRHGEARMQQRGRRPTDIYLIHQYGSEVRGDARGVYCITHRDVCRETNRLRTEVARLGRRRGSAVDRNREHAIRRLKREIQDIERLAGWKLVAEGHIVVTCYRPNQKNWKQMRRK